MANPSPEEWFYSLPWITRSYLVAAVGCTVAFALGLVNGSLLLWDASLMWSKFQIWRPFTSIAFFGPFSLGFLFQLFLLVRYSSDLERSPFVPGGGVGTPADYVLMLLCCQVTTLLASTFMAIAMPGPPMVFSILYVWSRRFPDNPISFFGFRTQGIYLPWVMLAFAVLIGQNPVGDLIGIAAGHLFYFLVEVVPQQYGKQLLTTPQWLRQMVDGEARFVPQPGAAPGAGPALGGNPFQHRWGRGQRLVD